MKNHRFFAPVLAVWVFAACPAAAENSASTVKMSISANENYLRRFRKEREGLAQVSDAEAAKKRASLDQKIRNLESDNQRLRTLLEKLGPVPSAPAPVPAPASAAPVSSAPPPAPAPALSPVKAAPQAVSAAKPSALVPPPNLSAESGPIAPQSQKLGGGMAVAEWEKMSREQKEKYVQDLVQALRKEGKVIERHPLFYTALMDYVFVSDSQIAAKPLKDAVIATIRKNEPGFSPA